MDEYIRQLMERLNEIQDRMNQLDLSTLQLSQQLENRDTSDFEARQAAIGYVNEVRNQSDAIAANLKQALAIAEEISSQQPEPEVIPANDLANQFRTMIDNLRVEALKTETESAAILKSLDVELKGLVVVKEEKTGLVMPLPNQRIDPGQLSTIRMSFSSIPVLPKNLEQP